MRKKERYAGIIGYFSENKPSEKSELNFSNAYELIVAVVLSAQCTDRRVNLVTPALFDAFPDVKALAAAEPEDILDYIRSISYPNSKAAHLSAIARKIASDFNCEIPSDIDKLMTLPGVGRKTANVVASIIYNEPVIAVDTHVFRVSGRLGLSDGKTPEAVEKDLESNIPEKYRAVSHHWLILHGRYICTARAPRCPECPLQQWCRHRAASLKAI